MENNFLYIFGGKQNILVLGKGPTRGLDNGTITAEAKYPINLTESTKRFVLSLHYNGNNKFLFVNTVKMYQFKANDSEIKPYPLYLGIISKTFTLNNMKRKTVLKGIVKVFSSHYVILSILRKFKIFIDFKWKERNIKQCLELFKKCLLWY